MDNYLNKKANLKIDWLFKTPQWELGKFYTFCY